MSYGQILEIRFVHTTTLRLALKVQDFVALNNI